RRSTPASGLLPRSYFSRPIPPVRIDLWTGQSHPTGTRPRELKALRDRSIHAVSSKSRSLSPPCCLPHMRVVRAQRPVSWTGSVATEPLPPTCASRHGLSGEGLLASARWLLSDGDDSRHYASRAAARRTNLS